MNEEVGRRLGGEFLPSDVHHLDVGILCVSAWSVALLCQHRLANSVPPKDGREKSP